MKAFAMVLLRCSAVTAPSSSLADAVDTAAATTAAAAVIAIVDLWGFIAGLPFLAAFPTARGTVRHHRRARRAASEPPESPSPAARTSLACRGFFFSAMLAMRPGFVNTQASPDCARFAASP